ncbi:MAG: hypothetical protein QM658_04105 [Gordonia sp. (in: high G+C Gram-positive bacteria)]
MFTHQTHHGHGSNMLSLVAFTALMVGGVFSALWLITLTELPDHKTTNITYGCVALFLLVSAAVIWTALTRKLHHTPMMPDNTPEEVDHYLYLVGRAPSRR